MRTLGLALVVLASAAHAQVRPTPIGSDPMQQAVSYADGQTVILETAPGFHLTVELAPRERIRTAAVGDTSRWEVSAPAGSSQFFVRPQPGAATTNLSVVTDSHVYYFLLVPASTMTHSNPLSVRFSYPEPISAPEPSVANAQAEAAPMASYRLTGTASVRPSRMWDDGAKTYLEWPQGAEMPAVFAVGPDGSEMLVNGFMRGDQYVIDAIYVRLVFRIDRSVARADRQSGAKS